MNFLLADVTRLTYSSSTLHRCAWITPREPAPWRRLSPAFDQRMSHVESEFARMSAKVDEIPGKGVRWGSDRGLRTGELPHRWREAIPIPPLRRV